MRLILLLLLPLSALATPAQLIVNPISIRLPSPSESDLDKGYVQDHEYKVHHAVKIEVVEGSPKVPWRLYVKAKNPHFQPSRFRKNATDLAWKHNAEENNAYRTVSTSKALVFSGDSGEGRRLKLDLAVRVDWADPSSRYSLPLTFILEEQ